MTKTTKKILLQYVLAPILMVIFLWLIYKQLIAKGDLKSQWEDLKSYASQLSFLSIIGIFLLSLLNFFSEAIKWQRVVLYIHKISKWQSLKAVITGISFGMVTPGKLGDFAGRVLHLPSEKRVAGSVATLVTNLIQVSASFTAGITGLIYFLIHNQLNLPFNTIYYLALAIIGLSLILWFTKHLWLHWLSNMQWVQNFLKHFEILKRYKKRDVLYIYVFSLIKFITYNFQFLLLANLLGADIPWFMGMATTMTMYWLLMIIPSFLIADISIRGYIAIKLFIDTNIAQNAISLISASYLTWLLNLVIPAIVGSLMITRINYNSKKMYHDTKND